MFICIFLDIYIYMYINKCNISICVCIYIYIFSTELWYADLKFRHYTGIDGLIESVPASLEERRKKETGHRVTASPRCVVSFMGQVS